MNMSKPINYWSIIVRERTKAAFTTFNFKRIDKALDYFASLFSQYGTEGIVKLVDQKNKKELITGLHEFRLVHVKHNITQVKFED